MPSWCELFMHLVRAAASRTFCTAGSSSPIRMAMMAITTSNSIKVKPRRFEERRGFIRRPPDDDANVYGRRTLPAGEENGTIPPAENVLSECYNSVTNLVKR